MSKTEQPSLIGDFALTMVFAVAQLLLAPISMSLLARHLGPHDFGAFSSLQRLVLFIAPLASVGVNVGLTRYLASVRGKSETFGYFWSAAVISLCGALIAAILTGWALGITGNNTGSTPSAWLFFLLLAVFIAQILVGAWLRGNGDYLASNVALLLSEVGKLCLIILIVMYDPDIRIAMILLAITSIQLVINIGMVAKFRPIHLRPGLATLSMSRTLLGFSAPRVLGGLSLQALYSIGVFYFALLGNPEAAGYMALSLVILNAGSMVFSRLGSILMPHLAFELSKSENDTSVRIPAHVKTQLSTVINLLLMVAAIVGSVGLLLLPSLIVPWLGQDYAPTEMPVAVLSSCIGIIALYSVLSGAINAADTRPLNTFNLFIVVMVAGGALLLSGELNITQVALVQALAFTLLALLTVITVCRLYSITAKDIGIPALLLLTSANIATAFLTLQISQSTSARLIGMMVILTLDLALIFKLDPPWLIAVRARAKTMMRGQSKP